MNKTILALTVLLASTSSFAAVIADGMSPTMRCGTPGMADGGYRVEVSAGGLVPHTEAALVQDTIRGGVLVDNYTVGMYQTREQDTVLADLITHGQTFQLVLHGQPLVGAPVQAILRSNSKAGRFNLKLICARLIQNR